MAQSALRINTSGIPSWQTITTSQAIVPGVGYVVNAGSTLTLTLPATFKLNDTFFIWNHSTGFGFNIAQNANQFIRGQGTSITTTGVGGSIQSASDGCFISFACIFLANENIELNVLNMQGSFYFI